MNQLDFPSIPLMEAVVTCLSPTPVTRWTLETRAVRFTYRGSRYRVGLLNTGGLLIEEVGNGVLSSGRKADKMYALLKGVKINASGIGVTR